MDTAAQVTTGNPRRGEQHWVYERAGRPCRRCGHPVAMAEQGEPPYQRFAYWCPHCQPGPAPAPLLRERRPQQTAGRPATAPDRPVPT